MQCLGICVTAMTYSACLVWGKEQTGIKTISMNISSLLSPVSSLHLLQAFTFSSSCLSFQLFPLHSSPYPSLLPLTLPLSLPPILPPPFPSHPSHYCLSHSYIALANRIIQNRAKLLTPLLLEAELGLLQLQYLSGVCNKSRAYICHLALPFRVSRGLRDIYFLMGEEA